MNRRILPAAIAIVLIVGVVGLAVELDARDPGVAVHAADGKGAGRASGDHQILFEESEPPVPPTLDREAEELEELMRRRDELEAVVVPPPAVGVPALPKPPPAAAAPVPSPPASSPRPDGSDCGTPSGYGGYGADETTTVGTTKVTLQIYSCHLYDGDQLQNFVFVDDPSVVVKAVKIDYGDGATDEGGVFPWSCGQSERPNPYTFNGRPHAYAAAKTYRVTATVTWARCTGGVEGEQTTAIVSMPVHRHAGPRPG